MRSEEKVTFSLEEKIEAQSKSLLFKLVGNFVITKSKYSMHTLIVSIGKISRYMIGEGR